MPIPSPPSSQVPPRRSYGRARAATLIGIHLLFGVHIAHWQLNGRTLAPLELNELMYTLEVGIVTAGFLFMGLAMISVILFGRFFCSWLCHVLALQDLCTWLLEKVRIRAKPVRSRALRLVPFGAMFYMFIWPQVARLWRGEPLPSLRLATDEQNWASFVTEDFWRNLPGPWIAGLTFAICGFAIVYMLGSRSFCANACPYGAIFGIMDRFAPGRLVLRGDCTSCGKCTAVCQSGVWVHEEVKRFGKVVDPACLKDLDCVAACPTGALVFGFTKPALFSSWRRTGRRRRPWHTSIGEDIWIGFAFVTCLLIFRGLYGVVPFLMSLGVGAILAYTGVLLLRLLRDQHASIAQQVLRRRGRLTRSGWAFLAFAAAAGTLVSHSALIRYHEYRGNRGYQQAQAAIVARDGRRFRAVAPAAIAHLSFCTDWSIVDRADQHDRLANLIGFTDDPGRAEPHLRRLIEFRPESAWPRAQLAGMMLRCGRYDAAATAIENADALLTASDNLAVLAACAWTHQRLAQALTDADRSDDAAHHQRRAIELQR